MSEEMGTILVVDDEPDLLEIFEFRLEYEGFEVASRSNAVDALEYLKSNRVSWVLSDVRMPSMSGVDFLRNIKANIEEPPCVYLVTGSLDLPVEEIYDIGAGGIFLKPLDFEALIKVLKADYEKSKFIGEPRPRRFERHEVDLEVTLDHKGGASHFLSHTVNLGRGGFFVSWEETIDIPKIGDQLNFSMKFIFDSNLSLAKGQAEVMWVRRSGDSEGQKSDGIVGVGLKFLNIDKPANDFWWLLNSLQTRAYIPMGI